MTPRPSKEPGPPPLESLPSRLRMAIVKLMAKDNLDVEEAYDKAANLIDSNGRLFEESVEKEAQRLYKSRLMREVNAARVTIQTKADDRVRGSYNEWYNDGYLKGKADHQIYYFCSICKKRMDIALGGDDHKALIQYMYDHGWGHNECHQKQRR